MKIGKIVTLLSVAALLSLTLAACGGGQQAVSSSAAADASASADAAASADAGAAGAAAAGVTPFSSVSGATAVISADSPQASINVEVAEGENLVIMGKIDDAETMTEVKVATSKDGEWFSDDSFYSGGSGCSSAEVEPGSYTVEIDGAGATGTIWALAFPKDGADFTSADTDALIDSILSSVS